jgi:hypothetical protein
MVGESGGPMDRRWRRYGGDHEGALGVESLQKVLHYQKIMVDINDEVLAASRVPSVGI